MKFFLWGKEKREDEHLHLQHHHPSLSSMDSYVSPPLVPNYIPDPQERPKGVCLSLSLLQASDGGDLRIRILGHSSLLWGTWSSLPEIHAVMIFMLRKEENFKRK